ncbi:replication protein [Candidatus Enterococcus courvalinii]|uniref:Replication protein n=1 Tax=Candidatus Enterococcus courvalinii TaxID=2815329 RepID=A0ABS3I0N0_9ENTE|nr:replication protein [Enterococcus sp. MSG2901]MBO0482215.1 replication protein [Enterococcus sp. MSG2901]
MTETTNKQRSNKWAFLIYKESAPENYIEILNEIQVPYILSPWHDKDIDTKTKEFKKSHKHGALFFESLKSYTQVSELISEKLNGPSHVQIVMSPRGMFDYFTHAENPEKTSYDIKDIESGAGFDLDKFLLEQNSDTFMNDVIDVIEDQNITEFEELVYYARDNNYTLLSLIVQHTFFFSKYLDSRRHNPKRKKQQDEETNDEANEIIDSEVIGTEPQK